MIDALYDASQRGHPDRPDRARHLLPAPAGAGAVGDDPRALDRRPVPRALPGLPLRRRSRDGRVPHRFGRPHAPQPRPPGRGARAGHRSPPARPAGRDARRSTSPTTRSRGSSRADGTWHKIPTVVGDLHAPRAPGAGARSGPRSLTARRVDDVEHERELKFSPGTVRSGSRPRRPRRTACTPTRADTVRLQATYFDTADLRLARAGASLRYRNVEGWTVKLPVAHDAARSPAHELHVDGEPGRSTRRGASTSCTRSIRRAPLVLGRAAQHRAQPRRAARRRGHVSSAKSSTTRCRCSTACASRRGSASSRWSSTSRRRPSASAALVATRLRAAGAGRARPGPEDRARARPARARPARPRRAAEARLRVRRPPRSLQAAIVDAPPLRLLAHDPGVRLGDDPEDVHQARVATRRLRSDLRTFRPVVDAAWSEPLRDELKWLGGLLGAVRDTEVLLDRLEAPPRRAAPNPTSTTASSCSTRSREHRDDAPRRAARGDALRPLPRAARPARRGRARADARRRARRPSTTRASSSATSCASRGEAARRGGRRSATTRPTTSCTRCASAPSARRYAAEAVAPARRQGRRRTSRRRSPALQDVLGEHQDAVVAGEWLRDHVPTATARRARVRRRASSSPSERRRGRRHAREQWPDGVEAARSARSCAGGCELRDRRPRRRRRRAARRAPTATAGAARAPAPVRRLEPAQGQGRPGESDEETALREVEEETGLRCTLGAPAGETRYRDSKGRHKVVRYWLMEPTDESADDAFVAQRRGRRAALVHGRRSRRAC